MTVIEAHYDEDDNCIYAKYLDGNECWFEYNDSGNCMHVKNSNNLEVFYEYDENGVLIQTCTRFPNGTKELCS